MNCMTWTSKLGGTARIAVACLVLLGLAGVVPAQTCGDLDYSGGVDINDLSALISYLYTGAPAPDPLWIADVDGVPGITHNDIMAMVAFGAPFQEEPYLRCDVTPDTTFPQSADTVYIRSTTVPAGHSEWAVHISLRAIHSYLGIALPFSFDCSTSSILLNSVGGPGHGYLIDSVDQRGVVTYWTWPENPPGEQLIASLYFSLTPADFDQEILIDTTFVPPSHTTVLSREGGLHFSTGHVPVLVTKSGCCWRTTGNIDCDPDDMVDISDIQALIDNLFLTLTPLCCEAEANLNYPGSGYSETDDIVDITDLAILIDNQYLTLAPLSDCP